MRVRHIFAVGAVEALDVGVPSGRDHADGDAERPRVHRHRRQGLGGSGVPGDAALAAADLDAIGIDGHQLHVRGPDGSALRLARPSAFGGHADAGL